MDNVLPQRHVNPVSSGTGTAAHAASRGAIAYLLESAIYYLLQLTDSHDWLSFCLKGEDGMSHPPREEGYFCSFSC